MATAQQQRSYLHLGGYPWRTLGLSQGETGADLSSTGPGFLKQAISGGSLVPTSISEADLFPSLLKNTDSYSDPSWIASLSAAKISGAVAITSGGSGQRTAAADFNALSPTTRKGVLIVNNGTSNIRVAAASDGSCLISDSASSPGVKWGNCGQGHRSSFIMMTAGQGAFRPLTGTFNAEANAHGACQSGWVNGNRSMFHFTVPSPLRLDKHFALSNGNGSSSDVLTIANYNDSGTGTPETKVSATDVAVIGNSRIAYTNQTRGGQITLPAGTYWLAFSYYSTTGQWYQHIGCDSMLRAPATKYNMSMRRYVACSNMVTYYGAAIALPSTCTVSTASASDTPPLMVVEE